MENQNLPNAGTNGATKKNFLYISEGAIVTDRRTNGQCEQFDSVRGKITSIDRRQFSFNGLGLSFYDIHILIDGEDKILSLVKHSSEADSIINALASIEDMSSVVTIKPWLSKPAANGKTYTNVSVYYDHNGTGERALWAVKLPKYIVRNENGREVFDFSEKDKVVEGLVDAINDRILSSQMPF